MGTQRLGHLIKALVLAFFTTALLIVIFAFVMYKFNLNENIISVGVTFIYIISCVLGGFYAGRAIKEKKFMWGLLVGLIYLVALLIVSAVFGGGLGLITENGISLTLLCLGGGMLGGMIA